jgi:hypothetical protein
VKVQRPVVAELEEELLEPEVLLLEEELLELLEEPLAVKVMLVIV